MMHRTGHISGILFFCCWLLAGLLWLPQQAQAQFLQEDFGQNRIQYKKFNWKYYNTQNFSVYYYAGGEELATRTAEFAEKELKRITGLIGYYPYSRITLILYTSVADLQQSNIGLNDNRYETGGETFFLKNRIELAFEGTQVEFKSDLSYRISELLLNDMMYGGSLKEVLQSTYLLRLPDWFVSGAAAYIAEGWSVEMDNYMRDMIERTEGKKPEQVFYRNQTLAGQSIWNYIAERYGYTAMQNILNLTRITRDIDIGISSSLNVSFKRFLREWHNYYVRMNALPETNLEWLDEEKEISKKKRQELLYTQPAFSPDGSKLAYIQNDRGRYEVKVYDLRTGKRKTIHDGGYRSPEQQTNYKVPVLAWRNNAVVTIAENRKGFPVVRHLRAGGSGEGITGAPKTLFNTVKRAVTGKDERAIPLHQFSQVLSMNYAADGKTIAVSAVKKGQSDIFILKGNNLVAEQITNDIFDDLDPVYLPNSNNLLFSSNRWVDTLGRYPDAMEKVVNNFDIFLYSSGNAGYPFRQLTFSLSNEQKPLPVDAYQFLFLSEESGIRSLYQYNLQLNEATPVSGFVQNMDEFAYHPASGLAFTGSNKNRSVLYYYPAYTIAANPFPVKTVRQQTLEDRVAKPAVKKAPRKVIGADSLSVADTVRTVDPENYQFEAEKKKEKKKTVVAKTTPEAVTVTGPFDYDLRFSINNVVTSFYRDPLLGFGVVTEVGMSDLFENHRIRGGVFFSIADIRTSRFYAEYNNLRNRYDFRFSYKKESLFVQQEAAFMRFGRHEVKSTLSYPLTHAISVKAIPTFVSTRFTFINNF
ncbi:MAG: hypothetical protein LPK19_09875, partial [Hymenobacteraceae bacterium]|nr:hypothetical protein [Hymenobacteraceae bacterium]MDX5396530.1 hypothetical protein [Hymenobacteraceae bacterium]MDX5512594.1 hypothetical protein [Hymenobacteraceae bacterium]